MTRKLETTMVASLSLAALLICAGCSKPTRPDPGPDPGPTPVEADTLASLAADRLMDGGPLALAGSLILGGAGAPGTAGARRARVASRGSVNQDSSRFDYQITCYDLSGQPVDWESAPYDSIDRLVMTWEIYANYDGADSGWAWHWHQRGRGGFDFRGFSSQSSEFRCDGASRDSSGYAWSWADQAGEGRGLWSSRYQAIRWSKVDSRYPLGGVIAIDMDQHWRTRTTSGEERHDLTVSVEVRYNGTHLAELIVAGYHYQLDLDTGVTTRLYA